MFTENDGATGLIPAHCAAHEPRMWDRGSRTRRARNPPSSVLALLPCCHYGRWLRSEYLEQLALVMQGNGFVRRSRSPPITPRRTPLHHVAREPFRGRAPWV